MVKVLILLVTNLVETVIPFDILTLLGTTIEETSSF